MIVEIDIGNTRIKWRLREGAQSVTQRVLHPEPFDLAACEHIFSPIDAQIDQVLIASVVPSCHPVLEAWCYERFGFKPLFAETQENRGDVINGYHDVSQMGVDRWLALLGAWQCKKQACLVVDAGSAATIDLLSSNGRHLGGYIVPGLRLMNDALFRKTDRVKVGEQVYPEPLRAGTSTQEAVMNGLPLMLLGAIEQAYDQLYQSTGVNMPIVLTGGDGAYLSGLLGERGMAVELVEDLVLDGLVLALGSTSGIEE